MLSASLLTVASFDSVFAFDHLSGFWNAYQTVQSQTQKQVAAALAKCPSCRTIRCTGHSLGAALATHAAVDLSFIYKANTTAPAIKLTTFGSPRVGDLVFSTYVQNQMKASWRYAVFWRLFNQLSNADLLSYCAPLYYLGSSLNHTECTCCEAVKASPTRLSLPVADRLDSPSFRTHYCDPVPHLPPTLKEINWHHVATEIYEGKDANSYKQCNGSGEDPSCADGILLPFKPSDHLDYMGVSVEAGKAQTCQTHGADCSVFMAKWMELNNRP